MTKVELKKYLERTDIQIDNNVARWDISTNGDINGLYTGTFVFRCFLTPTQKLAAGRDFRELIGPNNIQASDHEDNLAFTLSQLKHRVLTAPPFWSSSVGMNGLHGDIPDEKVLDVILEAALASEFKHSAILQEKREKELERAKKLTEAVVEDKKQDVVAEEK
jgi:hypothetical protein